MTNDVEETAVGRVQAAKIWILAWLIQASEKDGLSSTSAYVFDTMPMMLMSIPAILLTGRQPYGVARYIGIVEVENDC